MQQFDQHIKPYVSEIEAFLTSILLEETDVDILESQSMELDGIMEEESRLDVLLIARDTQRECDVIVGLEKAWYGLLSSIMLGIEEKELNDKTRKLLLEFADNLSNTFGPTLEKEGINVDFEQVRVVARNALEEEAGHTAYEVTHLEIKGLADDSVYASLLVGDPEAVRTEEAEEQIEEEPEPAEEDEMAEEEDATPVGANGTSPDPTSTSEKPEEGAEKTIPGQRDELEQFKHMFSAGNEDDLRSMDLLGDVEVELSVELGRREMPLGDILQMVKGSVIQLEKLAGEPVDIFVNDHCIAHGEVVVIDEHFGVRISSLVNRRQRMAKV